MRPILIGFIALIVVIALAAWTVGRRTRGVTLPGSNTFGSSAPASEEGALPVLADHMPEFADIQAWIDSDALTPEKLKGKVVLIDFWTYSCINCIRTLPYVTSWQEKYGDKGFTVIGVHTPEFAFEKEEKNVREAMQRFHITYPVALDNDYGTWNNYDNHYWPAHYLFDAQGRLRETHFGEGNYDETEMAIQELLKEAGHEAAMAVTAPTETPDFTKIRTPETYLGYARMQYLGSEQTVAKDAPGTYTVAKSPLLNRFYFDGTWTVEAERALPKVGAGLTYRYSASRANLVLGRIQDGGPSVRVDVTLDGKPVPEGLRGEDLNVGEDGTTYLLVSDERLYEITDAGDAYGEHVLRLDFKEPNAAAYAFTFG